MGSCGFDLETGKLCQLMKSRRMVRGRGFGASASISIIGNHGMQRFWCLASRLFVAVASSENFAASVRSLEKQLLDGAIILMHVGIRSTADALPAIIANLQGRGFHLVTISTLLESAPKSQ